MPLGSRTRKSRKFEGRRCSKSKCKKSAKDKIDGEYLCRLHSPMREAFKEALRIKKPKNNK